MMRSTKTLGVHASDSIGMLQTLNSLLRSTKTLMSMGHIPSDNMGWYFKYATAFNQDIGSWNTAQVTGMDLRFQASAFNQTFPVLSVATTAQTGCTCAVYVHRANGPASFYTRSFVR